jgi:hypothetical protein
MSGLVVVTGLKHHDIVAFDHVDQSMLGVDPSRPAALENVAQRFRLADPGEWVTQGVVDQPIDPLDYRLVDRLPMEVVGVV